MKDLSTKEWRDIICDAVQNASSHVIERHHQAFLDEDPHMAGLFITAILTDYLHDEHETMFQVK